MPLAASATVEIGFGDDPGTAVGATTWTDVTSDAIDVTINRGRQQELNQFGAGTATVILDNRSRRYDPSYTGAGAPYNGNIKPMRRLRVTADRNLMTVNQSSLETDTTGWLALTNCAIARSTAQAQAGSASLRLTSTAGGDMSACTLYGTLGFPVQGGDTYTLSAYLKAATSGRSITFEFDWFDSDGVSVSSDVGATGSSDTTSSWTLATLSAAAPSTAAYARACIQVDSTGAGGEVHYVDNISFTGPSCLFSGFIDGWGQQYEKPKNAVAVVRATDGFKVLAAKTSLVAYAATVTGDSPSAYWRLGDAVGSTSLIPTVGTGDLAITGSPTLGATGLQISDDDKAVTFASGQYAEVNGVNPLSGTAFSVEFYINTTAASTAYIMEVRSGTSASGVALDVGFNASITFGGVLDFFAARTDSSSNLRLNSTVAINDGVTHHVVVTMTSGNSGKVYVDGTDRTSTASALNGSGGFLPGRVRIGGTANANNFDGTLDEISIYPTALSATQVAAHYDAGIGWSGDTTGTRIGRMLDLASWPSADRNIDTGQTTLQAISTGTFSALSHSQAVETAEQGLFFFSATGFAIFIDRKALTSSPYNTSQATFGDSGSELPYREITYRYDDQLIYNEVVATRAGGVTQIASDATSQTSYLKRTKTLSDLQLDSDTKALSLAQLVVARYKDPLLRVTGLTIAPDADPTNLYPQVLGREIGDRITVKRRPQGVGSAISADVTIEGISHRITSGSWETSWNLSPADATTYWLLGTANSGELGTNTRLSF
jgi:hypothetical protein